MWAPSAVGGAWLVVAVYANAPALVQSELTFKMFELYVMMDAVQNLAIGGSSDDDDDEVDDDEVDDDEDGDGGDEVEIGPQPAAAVENHERSSPTFAGPNVAYAWLQQVVQLLHMDDDDDSDEGGGAGRDDDDEDVDDDA